AERLLRLAERTDPVRAHLALRASSHLAEITGYEERAVEFIERAVEAAPTDPWSLYQRGRLLAQRGDVDGALSSLLLALDQELEFPEALAELGRLAHARGDFQSAELYLERALSVDPELADVHALRGQNLLELGDVASAETSFESALKRDGAHPLALLGLAWVDYLRGDSQEAITGFAELDDSRRTLAEDDAYRVYAREQMERIREHEVKVVWSDRFDRTELQNGWQLSEEAGPLISLVDGRARLAGQFAGGEIRRTRMFRELAANRFVSFEADLVIKSGGRARMGLFLAREQFRRNSNDVQAEVLVSRHPDGDVQTRIIQRGEGDETPHVEHSAFTWETGQRVRLRLERIGTDKDARIRVMLDGVPVLEGARVPTLGRASTKLRFGVFVEGDSGRTVEAEVVRVELVYREVK
ncbi:MAG: tetratricopeptide repeat protein, partial [Planctomycetota bacterium]